MKNEDKIGLIGTGILGNAVGLHLLESNFTLTVYNRTKEKTVELKKNGAIIADSPKEVAKSSNLVITCVKDASAVRDVSFKKNGIIEGKHEGLVVADMSTINPIESSFAQNDIKHFYIEFSESCKIINSLNKTSSCFGVGPKC